MSVVQSDLSGFNFNTNILTKYLTEEQRRNLLSTFVNQTAVDGLVEALKEPAFAQILPDVEKSSQFALVALRAAVQKKISEEVFATIANVYSAINQFLVHPVRFEMSFNEEKSIYEYVQITGVTSEFACRQYKVRAIKIEKNPLVMHCLRKYFYIIESQAEWLIQSMAKEEPLERHFWVMDLPIGPTASYSPLMHRLQTISSFFHNVNRFEKIVQNPYPPHEPQWLLIPSFTLIKNFMQGSFPKSVYKAQVALGVISEEVIKAHKREMGVRLINIGIPGADNPEVADGVWGGTYGFSLHDFGYHLLRDSLIPKSYHAALLRIDELLERRLKDPMVDSKSIKAIQWLLFDNEIFGFNNEQGDGSVSKFGVLFGKDVWTQDAIDVVIQDMIKNKEIWYSWDIGFYSLNAKEQHRYGEFLLPSAKV